ncbi:MAG: DUF3842 family protein [Ruthenibacterium lactatiformans]
MDIVIIDGQGGGFGRALIEALRAGGVTQEIVAVGTNALATSAMLRAGASAGATGENAVIVNAARARILAGPIGLVMANSMLGECSPAMARAVAESPAHNPRYCQMRGARRAFRKAAGPIHSGCRRADSRPAVRACRPDVRRAGKQPRNRKAPPSSDGGAFAIYTAKLSK